ncbi:MAG: hypothetical protein Q7S44_03645 [bacterium]|nr:hypothetical protein [bacterium]
MLTNIFTRFTTKDDSSGSGILRTEYTLDDGQTVKTYTNPFTISTKGISKLKFRSMDKAGNEEIPQELEIKIDKTTPVIALNVSSDIIWPPDKQMINVTISGSAEDNISGLASKNLSVNDEYHVYNLTFDDLNQIVPLEAWRNGNDSDGRTYKVQAKTEDKAGNVGIVEKVVLVAHDQKN